MYRRLTVWELGSLWSWECCERDEGLELGDVDGSDHENEGFSSAKGKGIQISLADSEHVNTDCADHESLDGSEHETVD